jgi:hypothetical protein
MEGRARGTKEVGRGGSNWREEGGRNRERKSGRERQEGEEREEREGIGGGNGWQEKKGKERGRNEGGERVRLTEVGWEEEEGWEGRKWFEGVDTLREDKEGGEGKKLGGRGRKADPVVYADSNIAPHPL